jgi:UDP-2,3-diacylglucosamine pyrophosphatase LpxH
VPTRISYRSVFISDVHLGSRGCRARDLKSFLKRIDCEHLYLVGDIIDMWRLRQRWHWPAEHNDVARTILKLAKRGARVTYIPGNHDEHARQFIGLTFGDVRIRKNAVHTTADGRKLLITHGDEADLIITHARLLSKVGAWAYDTLIAINTKYNHLRAMMGLEYWSLSKHIKLKVKSACTFIARFEETLMAEARNKGFHGVVCGHIHKAEQRTDGDTLYFNCGDWIEGGTALVEHDDGTLQVIDAIALTNSLKAQEQALKDAAAAKSGAPSPEFRPSSTGGILIAAK